MREKIERILLEERVIHARLDALARELELVYAGRALTVVALMNGSLWFAADLLRRIDLPLRLETLRVSSYHGGRESSGVVQFEESWLPEVKGREVLVLDDILDSGRTLDAVCRRLLHAGQASSVRSCVLLRKNKERAVPFEADYVGFDLEDEFVVGFGLDYQGRYRNLRWVGVLSVSPP
jgi:hypoxanthine phosphoribosyltransferase